MMEAELNRLFDRWESKVVSATDKSKLAYVVTAGQRDIFSACGVAISDVAPYPLFPLALLGDYRTFVAASLYASQRAGANRQPEVRMGHELITSWLQIGDNFVVGEIAGWPYGMKYSRHQPSSDAVARRLALQLAPAEIFTRARRAEQAAPTRMRRVTTSVPARNPWIVAAAIWRAQQGCEMPNCISPLFRRDDGTPYLEVHHLQPLAYGVGDTLSNVAALCPACHRELHYGQNRAGKLVPLQQKIEAWDRWDRTRS